MLIQAKYDSLSIITLLFDFISKNPIAGLKKKFDLIFIFCGVEHIPSNLYECLKNNGGSLITVFYENNIGKIHVAKKLENKISRKSYINAQTPVIKEFKKTKREFIL